MTGGYGGADIIRGCTVEAVRGEVAVIVGPNGAGKTTAMKALFGMVTLRQGTVRLGGEGSYQPLRFTFLIRVMVIVGGSGNNMGAVLGGFMVWFLWVEAEPAGFWLMDAITAGLAGDHPLRAHLLGSAPYMRLFVMGAILLVVMRFSLRGHHPGAARPLTRPAGGWCPVSEVRALPIRACDLCALPTHAVMPGLVPGIHIGLAWRRGVDGRNKSGHDVEGIPRKWIRTSRTGL